MINEVKLREKIEESGLRYDFVAKNVGVNRYTLLQKIDGRRDFKVSEVEKLCRILDIKPGERDSIFFAGEVDKLSTTA